MQAENRHVCSYRFVESISGSRVSSLPDVSTMKGCQGEDTLEATFCRNQAPCGAAEAAFLERHTCNTNSICLHNIDFGIRF